MCFINVFHLQQKVDKNINRFFFTFCIINVFFYINKKTFSSELTIKYLDIKYIIFHLQEKGFNHLKKHSFSKITDQ